MDECDLYLMPIGGGEVRKLTDLKTYPKLAWSADGSQVIFSNGPRRNLWRLSVSGGVPEPIAAAGQGVGGPTLRGNRLAFAQGTVDGTFGKLT